MKTSLSFICFFCCTLFGTVAGVDLTRTYRKGPVTLTSSAKLFYEVDTKDAVARFALVVNDSAVIDDGAAWVGIGIGEPTSGSMIGADIVTAQFEAGAMNSCIIVDRYVPFVAYPWNEAPTIFPLPDDCPEPDWTLVSCQRNGLGATVFEVTRPLSVNDDKQDRAILPGDSNVLHAYGGQFGYHGPNRNSAKIRLYSEEGEENDHGTANSQGYLPSDIDGYFDLNATDYHVPAQLTTYACTTKRIPLPLGRNFMIIGGEPLLNNVTGFMVHHFIVYLCSGEEYYEQTKKTIICEGDPISGPAGNSNAACKTVVAGYAGGTSRVLYPENVGVLVDSSRQYLSLETHFNNENFLTDTVDNSGFRVYYTTKLRKNHAGSLVLGDGVLSRESETVKSGFRYQHTCPSACTQRFSKPINIFSSLLHMHRTGKKIHSNLYDENNKFLKNINKVNFWSDAFQKIRVFDNAIELQPGEQIQTVCEYDTSKRPATQFGIATKNEMCIQFLLYWPLQTDSITGHEMNICSYAKFDGQISTTLCGDQGRIDEMFSEEKASKFPLVMNPSFNDTVGAVTNFGSSDSQCLEDDEEFESPQPAMTDEPEESGTDGIDISDLFST